MLWHLALYAELTQLARTLQIPVTTTLMGLGTFPETDPLSLKMLGMHGTEYANKTIMAADLILAIGARFDDRITGKVEAFAPNAKIAHIDIDPSTIRKNVQVDIPVVGDIKLVLQELLKHIKPMHNPEWLKQVATWKKDFPLTYSQEGSLKPQFVVEKIFEITKGNAIISTEVGQNQMWAAQFYTHTQPRSFITSGGLGTMGYGFPAAIGAQVANPDALVFDIAGDGSIQMNIQEMATAVNYSLPIKIAILNNNYLGMVRQWQEIFYAKRYAGTCLSRRGDCPPDCEGPGDQCPPFIPDFVKIAEAYGATGIRITQSSEVTAAIEKAIQTDGPVIMEFIVEKTENVFPMVPAGAPLDQMIRGLA